MREIEYPLIALSLSSSKGNQLKASKLLGINRNTLRKKINELDINQNLNENGIYDILGREWKTNFANLPKGVYIINGRKVFKTK